MRSLLDQMLDKIEERADTLIVWQSRCEFPELLTQLSWERGCRCGRCVGGNRHTRRSEWSSQ